MLEKPKKRSDRQKTVPPMEKLDPGVPPITEIAAKSGTFPKSDKNDFGPTKRKRVTKLELNDIVAINVPHEQPTTIDLSKMRELLATNPALGKLIALFGLKMTKTK